MLRERGRVDLCNKIDKSPSQKEIISAKLKALFPKLPKTFGEKLKYWRLKNNLLQKDLAKMLKVHKVTICRYEKSFTYPSRQIIQKFIRVIKTHKLTKALVG